MTRNRPKFLPVAACIGGMLVSMSLCAADLSIPRASVAGGSSAATTTKYAVSGTKPHSRHSTRMKKQQRADKTRRQRIVTYNLFGDPVFKLPGAVNDKRQFAPLGGAAGSVAGYVPSAASTMPPGGLLSRDEADGSAGIAFDCRDNPGGTHAIPRRVTACYKAQLDKGWQTQTYVSKGFAANKSDWGGGVSVMYAH